MSTPFVHLRLHTEYSLRDSIVRVPELVAATSASNAPAVAVTDLHNLFALVKFYNAALSAGVQPIVGVDVDLRGADERAPLARLCLLAQNERGYRNLTQLVSRGWLEGQRKGVLALEPDWLDASSTEGLIALSGAQLGDIGMHLVAGREPLARAALQRWLGLFGDRFYLELQRVGHAGEEQYLSAALQLAAQCDVPVVATNDVRFMKAEEFETHEARVCIHERRLLADAGRPRHYTPQQYLRTPAEMAELFADIPEALENTLEIARRCSLSLSLGKARLPDYPVPDGSGIAEYLEQEASRGLARRFSAGTLPTAEQERYQERLRSELAVIGTMGFAGYFMIVADFIDWARHNGVPVGPGRGSGAGSLVAYALGITDIDPLRYDLLFERFLNPERVSMPDFDIDFCMEGRDRVIDYVAQKYGTQRVSQIITYGTMAAKAVVRDVGRVQGHPYGFVDRIAKLIPFDLEMTLDKALKEEPELKRLYKDDEDVKALLDMARALEGLTRNAGKHAGGVVIAPSKLTDFAPLYCEEGGLNVVTQFDKEDVEAAGLVKFDFLGLRTLTVIDWAVRTINTTRAAAGEPPLVLSALAMDDEATFQLFRAARTAAVFQLESRGMRDLMRRLKPDNFEDIVALVALFRPGPLQSGMADEFIERKRNNATIDYLHPDLKNVLAPTYGVILYQEQVMQIAQVLAGYTLGGADLLRRAMGKKDPEAMARQRSTFVGGAVARGVREAQAAHIFDLMEKFAGYGFNKSHSAAYAVLSYQTAWLKVHHPAAFMAAVLSADMDHTDKIVALINECAEMELAVLPPSLNASEYRFVSTDARTIRYGLGAVKGVGQSAVENICNERRERGRYASLEDVCRRVDATRVNKRVLEALIRSGSCDDFAASRAQLMARLPDAMLAAEQSATAASKGQSDLFGGATASDAPESGGGAPQGASVVRLNVPEWSEAQRLAGERETLGLYLTGHPIGRYERELKFLTSGRIGDYAAEERPTSGETPRWADAKQVTVAGLVLEVQRRGPRVSLLLDDRSGRIEASLSEEVQQRFRELAVKDSLLLVEGPLRFDEFSGAWRITARNLYALDLVRETRARTLVLDWPQLAADPGNLDRLATVLATARGTSCQVAVRHANHEAAGTMILGSDWNVRPSKELIDQLEQLCGAGSVRLSYGAANESNQSASG